MVYVISCDVLCVWRAEATVGKDNGGKQDIYENSHSHMKEKMLRLSSATTHALPSKQCACHMVTAGMPPLYGNTSPTARIVVQQGRCRV